MTHDNLDKTYNNSMKTEIENQQPTKQEKQTIEEFREEVAKSLKQLEEENNILKGRVNELQLQIQETKQLQEENEEQSTKIFADIELDQRQMKERIIKLEDDKK